MHDAVGTLEQERESQGVLNYVKPQVFLPGSIINAFIIWKKVIFDCISC